MQLAEGRVEAPAGSFGLAFADRPAAVGAFDRAANEPERSGTRRTVGAGERLRIATDGPAVPVHTGVGRAAAAAVTACGYRLVVEVSLQRSPRVHFTNDSDGRQRECSAEHDLGDDHDRQTECDPPEPGGQTHAAGRAATCHALRVTRRGPVAWPLVATFALIHGGGSSSWDWHLVVPELRQRGHDPVAVDLPSDDESAGWSRYVDVVVDAVGARGNVIVVGHSLGGFTAPLVCARVPVDLLILVAAMIPSPGELFDDWWANSGYENSGYDDVFYHDVPPELAAEAERRSRDEKARALREPWPLDAWPETPTRYLLCREDRMFTADWARRHARERLGLVADEIDGGHYVALTRPAELAARLDAYAAGSR